MSFLIGGPVSMTSSWGRNIDLLKCLKHVVELLSGADFGGVHTNRKKRLIFTKQVSLTSYLRKIDRDKRVDNIIDNIPNGWVFLAEIWYRCYSDVNNKKKSREKTT